MVKPLIRITILACCLWANGLFNTGAAQCINSFPYNEGFENSGGGWVVNGSLPSWAWGIPAKPTINIAGGGNKCWVTGGLTNDYYNDGEASWLQSPCFDFSTVLYPYIKMKIWWETEQGYDGASLQYSTDNGNTWTNVGSGTGNSNCSDSNWYNLTSVRFLGTFGSAEGWSGSVKPSNGNCAGGGGSGRWVTAGHSLNGLGGLSNVILRFTFGAGTQCNNFDGFAVDDISISDAIPGNGEIFYNCIDSITAAFSLNAATCPASFSWNFGDPASSANNTTNAATPQHTFSGAGTYTISVTAGGNGIPSFTAIKTITILSAIAKVATPIACTGGATGAASVTVTASPSPLLFTWLTNPAQNTQTATGIPAGTYTVTVAAANACNTSATVSLLYDPILVSAAIQQPGCLAAAGEIALTTTGGDAPLSYTWVPSVSTSNVAANLPEASYSVSVKDNRGCINTNIYTIAALPKPVITIVKLADANCNGASLGSAAVKVQGGTPPFNFLWDNQQQNTDTAKGFTAGAHTVVVTDVNGCSATGSIAIAISGICNEVYFPNSFSPDDDGKNDFFGPLGNLVAVSRYSLNIFNRYGQLVFSSNNPLIKWNGSFKGKKAATGSYVWQASYTYNGNRLRMPFGTVTIIH